MSTYPKTGYLMDEFKSFYICDSHHKDISYHYHDFNKLLIFLNGNASYYIEGKVYPLMPYDIVYVKAGQIHKPLLHDNSTYERMIFYFSPKFLEIADVNPVSLSGYFKKAEEAHSNLLRLEQLDNTKIYPIIEDLKQSFRSEEFATEFYQKTLFYQLLIWLNRAATDSLLSFSADSISNPLVLNILAYINQNLETDLTIDTIASQFFLNRSYVMHLFKAETGYTIGNYITEKRLFSGKKYILDGMSVTDACYKCGFTSYSSFYRSFKERFGVPPKQAKASNIINP